VWVISIPSCKRRLASASKVERVVRRCKKLIIEKSDKVRTEKITIDNSASMRK
jgi:hypothetical protein